MSGIHPSEALEDAKACPTPPHISNMYMYSIFDIVWEEVAHMQKQEQKTEFALFAFFIHISEPATTHCGHLFCLFLPVSLSKGHVGFCFICARSSPIELH